MLYYKEGRTFFHSLLFYNSNNSAIVKYLSSLKNSCVSCVSNLLTCAQCIQYSSSKHWRKCVKEKCCRYTVWNSLCLPTSILSQKQQISFRKFVLEIYYEVTQGTLKKVLCALCCLISIQIQNYRQSHRNRSSSASGSGSCKKNFYVRITFCIFGANPQLISILSWSLWVMRLMYWERKEIFFQDSFQFPERILMFLFSNLE